MIFLENLKFCYVKSKISSTRQFVGGGLSFLLALILISCSTARVLCRAGGKPSTWFPPGTRRAGHFMENRR